jgi:hypothetical protein
VTLNMVEVAQLAIGAGLRDPLKLATAVAVATAESGLNPSKKGDVTLEDATWGPSVGLWQIRSLKAEKGKGTTRDETKLTDPAFNAKAMMDISHGGTDFGPWSVTHVSDPAGYLRYTAAKPGAVTASTAALAAGGVTATAGAVTTAVDGATQVAGVISDAVDTPVRLIKWLTEGQTWVRIGYFVGGMVMIGLGLSAALRKPLTDIAAPIVGALSPTGKAGVAAKAASASTATPTTT